MHKAFVIVPLLAWAGVAVLVHQTRYSPDQRANEATVVVVPPRPVEAAGRRPVPQPAQRVVPAPGDRAALVRELHKELARVGCYDGDLGSVWTSASRRAMRVFTDRVNARLPIDEPDYILLRLVQGHQQKVCGIPCPPGQQDGPDGRCVSSALAAGVVRMPMPSDTRAEPTADRVPLVTGSATTAAAIAPAVPSPERSAVAPPANPSHAQPTAIDAESAQRSVRRSEPAPRVGMRERRRRHASRRASSRPPAAVRSLVRTVKRALGSFGIR